MRYIVIRNKGADETGKGINEVNQRKAFTGVSTVRITLSDGKEYVWGPGEKKTLIDPFGTEALAASNLLEEVSRS